MGGRSRGAEVRGTVVVGAVDLREVAVVGEAVVVREAVAVRAVVVREAVVVKEVAVVRDVVVVKEAAVVREVVRAAAAQQGPGNRTVALAPWTLS